MILDWEVVGTLLQRLLAALFLKLSSVVLKVKG